MNKIDHKLAGKSLQQKLYKSVFVKKKKNALPQRETIPLGLQQHTYLNVTHFESMRDVNKSTFKNTKVQEMQTYTQSKCALNLSEAGICCLESFSACFTNLLKDKTPTSKPSYH